ncbi:MAG: TonB-dependent receptor [Bacteroidetes bacterium]|nr:TonB-dependent receptor [Bacteroidota bacterium]
MSSRFAFLVLLLGLLAGSAFAQQTNPRSITGRIIDAKTGETLIGVNVVATLKADTTVTHGQVSDANGRFSVPVRAAGDYRVRFSYVGFLPQTKDVTVTDKEAPLGLIEMQVDVMLMNEVRVEAVQDRVEVRGDTTVFNAAAFKVNPDATTEDLLRKMPGIVVDGGQVQAQGETVQRVLVDGREFFGQDPAAALRNLPSEIVDRIEVYDRQSDQAQFTGFEDDNTQKTINIVTLTGRSNGQFGKVYGGYGSEERYLTGGTINLFDDDRRISIIGMSNNVNQQNFAIEDLMGVVGSASGRGGFGGGMRGGGGRPPGGGSFGGGRPGGDFGGMRGGDTGSFLVGNQGGVNSTDAFGLNYQDAFGANLQVTGSYFFNRSQNSSTSLLDREYYLEDTLSQLYNEENISSSTNLNHRFSGRVTYTINERNSLIFTPRVTTQSNEAASYLFGENVLTTAERLSQTTNDYLSDSNGMNASASLLLRHAFQTRGRTLSVNFTASSNASRGDTDQLSANLFFAGAADDILLDQRTDSDQLGRSLSMRLTYTEPVGDGGQIQVNYSPSRTVSDSERWSNSLDPVAGTYTILEPSLSSQFDNVVLRQRGGVSYTKRSQSLRVTVGVDGQSESLTGDQSYPVTFDVDRTFNHVLPSADIQFGNSRQKSLRLSWRTQTNTPSISQLQDVIDNRNPLQLSSGNPGLDPSYTNTLMARFNSTNLETGRVFFGFASVSLASDYIGTETTIAQRDMEIADGVMLLQGSQFSRPVNLDGQQTLRSFFTFGRPTPLFDANMNWNGGVTLTSAPGLINGEKNVTDVLGLNGGLVISSNISERLDFTVSENVSYNTSENSAYPQLNNTYTQYRTGASVTAMPTKALVLETSVSHSLYNGLGDNVDNTSLLWNAALGYKFLKGNGGEVRLIVADILNRNTNVSRSITEFYIQDSSSNVLGRYILLNFTYTLRNFRM